MKLTAKIDVQQPTRQERETPLFWSNQGRKERALNTNPADVKDNRTWWQKHETQVFNGIMKAMQYVAVSSVLWLGMYYLVQWLAK